MADWTMTPVAMSVMPVAAFQPVVKWTAKVGEHRVRMETTAKGYAQLTGRKHPRVKAMRAAYRRRR